MGSHGCWRALAGSGWLRLPVASLDKYWRMPVSADGRTLMDTDRHWQALAGTGYRWRAPTSTDGARWALTGTSDQRL
jgi:hypothetical protein